jgi:hypothetical protein
MAHWHGLAKLCMHSDPTLEIMDEVTTTLGHQFRHFKATVCSAYDTYELRQEVDACARRDAKLAAKQQGGQKGKQRANLAKPTEKQSKNTRRLKTFNFQTYKFHALGDYVSTIRRYGTSDSYSTEPVSLAMFDFGIDLPTLSRANLNTVLPRPDIVVPIAKCLSNNSLG